MRRMNTLRATEAMSDGRGPAHWLRGVVPAMSVADDGDPADGDAVAWSAPRLDVVGPEGSTDRLDSLVLGRRRCATW